ncbi:MAG TPA: alpha/beta hydrolase [Polyangiaceae bacterium]|nr:alpha/beta hydrolase [Polyangiaceae bacterium]
MLAAGCDRAPAPAPETASAPETQPSSEGRPESELGVAPAAPTSPPAPVLPPLRTDNWIVELPVAGFGSAVVVPPQGIRAPRAVVVALHGYGDRPDWQCGAWTGVTDAKVFVLCPRGIALPNPPGNFSYGSLLDTEREVLGALAALEQRFSGYVGTEHVLVGYSLGASRAAQLAARNPKRFPRVALIEGGSGEWSRGASRSFQQGGGERVLLVCSQAGCEGRLRALGRQSQGPNTEVRVEYLGPLGHTMGPKVTAKLKEPWRWLAADWLASGPPHP